MSSTSWINSVDRNQTTWRNDNFTKASIRSSVRSLGEIIIPGVSEIRKFSNDSFEVGTHESSAVAILQQCLNQ